MRTPFTNLWIHGCPKQFLFAKRLSRLSREDINGPLLQLTLDGPEENVQGFPYMLLREGGRVGVVGVEWELGDEVA